MKHKALKFGICLLTIGLIGIVFCGANNKININRMASADWQSCQHINGIGTETITKLENNAPFDQIQDVEKIDGIGIVKTAIIKHHFCTYDTCRIEIFVFALSFSCVLIVIGALLIIWVEVRRKCTADTLKEFIKKE
jgi:hypothetical protein